MKIKPISHRIFFLLIPIFGIAFFQFNIIRTHRNHLKIRQETYQEKIGGHLQKILKKNSAYFLTSLNLNQKEILSFTPKKNRIDITFTHPKNNQILKELLTLMADGPIWKTLFFHKSSTKQFLSLDY